MLGNNLVFWIHLKLTVSRFSRPFSESKTSTFAICEKRFREIVRVSEDIREKRVYIYVVVDYAETTMTTQTTTENCGGLSLSLKEQSIERSTNFLIGYRTDL